MFFFDILVKSKFLFKMELVLTSVFIYSIINQILLWIVTEFVNFKVFGEWINELMAAIIMCLNYYRLKNIRYINFPMMNVIIWTLFRRMESSDLRATCSIWNFKAFKDYNFKK